MRSSGVIPLFLMRCYLGFTRARVDTDTSNSPLCPQSQLADDALAIRLKQRLSRSTFRQSFEVQVLMILGASLNFLRPARLLLCFQESALDQVLQDLQDLRKTINTKSRPSRVSSSGACCCYL